MLAALAILAGRSGAQVQAQACVELIRDGGFETGGQWQLGNTPLPPDYVSSTTHTGSRSLRLGIIEGSNRAAFFVGPADAEHLGLSAGGHPLVLVLGRCNWVRRMPIIWRWICLRQTA